LKKLLANENVPLDSVTYLKNRGYDIKAIGIESFGISDKEVMAFAIAEERIIITFDRDYGELIFKHNFKPNEGVIYLRISEYESELPGIIIENLLLNTNFDTYRKLTVIDNDGIRQRSY